MTVYSSVNETAFAQAMQQATVLLLNAIATPTTAAFSAARIAAVRAVEESYGDVEAEMAQSLVRMIRDVAAEYLCPLHPDAD